ncbi:MAG: hypothetical protein ACOY3X_05495 [Pseudomonadota bacterium]
MKTKMLRLSLGAMLMVPVASMAEVTDEQMSALEARIAQLEAEGSGGASADAGGFGKVKVNGFMSAGFGRAELDDFSYDNGLDEEWSHKADAVVGLQLDAQVNDRTSAVVQLVGRGPENFDVSAEWAYIGYRPTAQDEVRAGRLRSTFFMMSEYLEVGYAYPWARPPAEVYRSGLPSSFEGLYWRHSFSGGDWTHESQLTWGSTKSPSGSTTPIRADSAAGIGLNSSSGNWQLSAKYSQADLTGSNSLLDALVLFGMAEPLEDSRIRYAALGAQYDNGSLLVMAEATRVDIDGTFADTAQAYLTVGYHLGKFLPHVTFASSGVSDKDERPINPGIPALCAGFGVCLPDGAMNGTLDGNPDPFPADTLQRLLESEQDSVTLGLRYDFLPNAAIKADWTHVLDTYDSFGLFARDDGNVFYGAGPGDGIDIFRVVVDVVF